MFLSRDHFSGINLFHECDRGIWVIRFRPFPIQVKTLATMRRDMLSAGAIDKIVGCGIVRGAVVVGKGCAAVTGTPTSGADRIAVTASGSVRPVDLIVWE
jgi:hypothetical protein